MLSLVATDVANGRIISSSSTEYECPAHGSEAATCIDLTRAEHNVKVILIHLTRLCADILGPRDDHPPHLHAF